jgi:hypothetical protein
MMNAFQSGSNADISLQNIEINQSVLNKQNSKQNFTKNSSFMMSGTEEIYGASTQIGNYQADNLSSGLGGSIKQGSNKMAYVLNEPSIDSYSSSQAIPVALGGRNRESGTMANNERKKNNQWMGDDGGKDIDDDDTKVPIPFNVGQIENIHA